MSFDVVLLFTKVPVERTTDISRERLLKYSTLYEQTILSPNEVAILLHICLDATYLAYKNGFYKQIFGTAMESPVSVTVANLVMVNVVARAFASYHSPPLFWKRYVDDVCTYMMRSWSFRNL